MTRTLKKESKILISIIWDLIIIPCKVCKGRKCIVYSAPIQMVKKDVYLFDKCYKYTINKYSM